MKFFHLLPLIAVIGSGCRSDEEAATPLKPRPKVTVEQQAEVDQSLSGQRIGQLLEGRTTWLREGKFEKGGLDRAPKFYLFYYSASW